MSIPQIRGKMKLVLLSLIFIVVIFALYFLLFVVPRNSSGACIQSVTTARNPLTGQIKAFPTPCNVPIMWEKVANSDTMIYLKEKASLARSPFKLPILR